MTTPKDSAPPVGAEPLHGHQQGGHHGSLMALSLAALGIVYGDIGTSPLYALRECFSHLHGLAPTAPNVYGVLSLIFWALISVVTFKYIIFILRADNGGEGGILALTALATPIRRLRESPRKWIVLLGIFGAALLYGDGVITPAISVLSAVEGLKVAAPGLETYVLPITIVILIGLFVIQSRGTATIGRLFGPIMIVWFAVLGVLGVVNIFKYPTVLAAVNPLYGWEFFIHNGWHGFLILGTVFLVVTGGEALYADMGHFGRAPIRVAWFALVLPMLLLNYFGQGALLLTHPEAAENSFYLLAPSWALYPLVGLATMATIIASQALISGAYSITMQAENLGFLPRMRIVHTSPTAFGQIYIPLVNWLLMFACIAVVLGFRTSSNLAAAYGIAVTSTMAITSIIFAVVAERRWHWPRLVVWALVGIFLVIDMAFFIANVVKIPQGGWFPLVLAAALMLLMTTWKRGNQLVFQREKDLEMTLAGLQKELANHPLIRTPGTALFLSANPRGAPAALLANIRYNGVIHERVVLVTINSSESHPHIADSERIQFKQLQEGLYQLTITYGFMEEPNVPRTLATMPIPLENFDPGTILYFVNRTRALPTKLPGMVIWREQLFATLQRNAASAADFFNLPPKRVFEINTSVEV